jgi:predicted transcriptional regulator
MHLDQLEKPRRKAGQDQTGSDADLRQISLHCRDWAADIARAFRSRQVSTGLDEFTLVRKIAATLEGLSSPAKGRVDDAAAKRVPAVPPHETIGLGFLICLEDGRNCRDLGRHLHAVHGLSPDQYRQRWGLPPAYPMLPPASHQERQVWRRRLAPRIGNAEPEPIILRLQEESRRLDSGRARRRQRRAPPARLRPDWGQVEAGQRSGSPQIDGFRR